jgi:phosphoesterase RecJ-like protein
MNQSLSVHEAIRTALHQADSIALFSHIRPDGDAIGSLLGLGLTLQHAGKKVEMVLRDGVPHNFHHLPDYDQIKSVSSSNADLWVVLDASDPNRIGGLLNGRQPDINIDHHVTNLNYGRINFIQPEAVATAAILAESIPLWQFSIPPAAAQALLTGILTDTIGFRTSNMTSDVLRLAAKLMDIGANLPELYRHALSTRSYESAIYWGQALARLQRQGTLIWTSLTLQDRQISGYTGNDDADLNNILSSIEDCDVSILFIEQKNGTVKVSWRAQPGWDVSALALQLGGGGHAPAAGADIPGTLSDVQTRVLQATITWMQDSNQQKQGTINQSLSGVK